MQIGLYKGFDIKIPHRAVGTKHLVSGSEEGSYLRLIDLCIAQL